MSTFSEANTASNDAAYVVSRSRMRNRNRVIRSSRFISRLRAARVVQAAVGCVGDAEDVDASGVDFHDEQDVEPA
jgi:hypothetical protein